MICKKIPLLFFLFFVFTNYSFANDKVVYLNVNYIINNSNLGKEILNKLAKINDENQKMLTNMENELKNKENDIIKIKNIISENELNNKMNLLSDEIKKYRNFKNKITSELNKSKENEIKFFFEKINPIIENYMNSNSITIIIDQKNIFIARSENDITNDILTLLNSKF